MKSRKPFLLTLVLSVYLLSVNAQMSNLVAFTQSNEPFIIILNGIQQSPVPETNIKITGLNAPSYKLKVIFENQAIPEIDKAIYLEPETEVTYEILKNSKGSWVMRLLNNTPIDEVVEQPGRQDVFVFTTTPRVSTTVVSQTTTISAGGIAGGATITTTTTQTTSGTTDEVEMYPDERYNYPEYRGPRGCPRPMNKHDFDQALESIGSKSFESSKLTIAKQIVGSNCLLCRQVKEVMNLFDFESTRLDFAKYAYKYTWDINNYYLLNDAFDFESSIDELNKYINGRK